MTKKALFFLIILFSISCFAQDEDNITIIKCDSRYLNKKISIKLTNYETEKDGYDGEKNTILEINQLINGKTKTILKESIFSKVQKIEFEDFNNDKIKDILIQNISDVRSNWTYNLYLYDPKQGTFKKVIGFEEIRGPRYNSKYNIVESYAVSGEDYLSFYKIIKNKIYDYNIQIIDSHNKKFDLEYKKAIAKIVKRKI